MNLRELKLLNSDTLNGYKYTISDITSIVKNDDYKFYGGRIEYYSIARNNPNVVLLLETYDNSYRIVDVGLNINYVANKLVEESKEKDLVKPVEEAFIEEESNVENIDIAEDKYVCPNCKREFKSKAGLGRHVQFCK